VGGPVVLEDLREMLLNVKVKGVGEGFGAEDEDERVGVFLGYCAGTRVGGFLGERMEVQERTCFVRRLKSLSYRKNLLTMSFLTMNPLTLNHQKTHQKNRHLSLLRRRLPGAFPNRRRLPHCGGR